MGDADSIDTSYNDFKPFHYTAGEEAVIISVDEKENVYQVVGHDAYSGESTYLPVKI